MVLTILGIVQTVLAIVGPIAAAYFASSARSHAVNSAASASAASGHVVKATDVLASVNAIARTVAEVTQPEATTFPAAKPVSLPPPDASKA